jgi:hypothetical protein
MYSPKDPITLQEILSSLRLIREVYYNDIPFGVVMDIDEIIDDITESLK